MKTSLIAAALLLLWADIARSQFLDPQTNHHKHRNVTCGATLSGNKTFTLSGDLDCSTTEVPITVTDRAKLDLNGHTLRSDVVLDGRRAQLKGGTLRCSVICITLQGAGKHLVENIQVRAFIGTSVAFWVISDRNSLIGNTVYLSEGAFIVEGDSNILRGNIVINFGAEFSFWIIGNGNHLSHNTSTGSNFWSFIISGNNNQVVQNTSADELSFFGFLIGGDFNRVARNVVVFNIDWALSIEAGGQNNIIEDNIAPNQVVRDLNANCDSNTWIGNIFGTADQDCIQSTSNLNVVSTPLPGLQSHIPRMFLERRISHAIQ
jgi:hypothetical protein